MFLPTFHRQECGQATQGVRDGNVDYGESSFLGSRFFMVRNVQLLGILTRQSSPVRYRDHRKKGQMSPKGHLSHGCNRSPSLAHQEALWLGGPCGLFLLRPEAVRAFLLQFLQVDCSLARGLPSIRQVAQTRDNPKNPGYA